MKEKQAPQTNTNLNQFKNSKKKEEHLREISKAYKNGLRLFEEDKLDLAEKEFVKALKPVLSKTFLEVHSPYVKLEDCKETLLDSMYHLGQIYLQSDQYPFHHAKATAIFQYCYKFSEMHSVENKEKYLDQAYSTEIEFLKSRGKKFDNQIKTLEVYVDRYNKHKEELTLFRSKVSQELDQINKITVENISKRAKEVENLYSKTTKFFVNTGVNRNSKPGFVQTLLHECYEQLGEPPFNCEFAILGLGSLAGGKMTPYSDLEFMILVNKDEPEYKEYLRNLTKLLHIKVVNLGETMLRSVGIESLNNFKTGNPKDEWFWDEVMNSGFSYDGAHWHACKLPYGRQGYKDKPDYELIMTPKQMAQFQTETNEEDGRENWFSSDEHLVLGLRSTILIDGKQELLDDYRLKVKSAVSDEVHQERVHKVLAENLEEFQLKLDEDEEGKLYDVKKTIYRLSDRIIEMLSELYGIEVETGKTHMTVWQKIEALKKGGYINDKGEAHLKEAISIATELRMQTYSHNKSQAEGASTYVPYVEHLNRKQKQELLHKTFYIKDTKILHHFYYVMLPLSKLLIRCIQNSEGTLQIDPDCLFDNGDYNRGLVHARLLQYDKAITHLEKARNEFPTNLDVLQDLSRLYRKTKMLDDNLNLELYMLELTRKLNKCDFDNPNLSPNYNNIGDIYLAKGFFGEAITYYCKAWSVLSKESKKSSYWGSELLNNIGEAFKSIGEYDKATEYHQKSLDMKLQIYKDTPAHPCIAISYNNLGELCRLTGKYNEAIEYYKKDLRITQIVYQHSPNHPYIADSYNNLGAAYFDMYTITGIGSIDQATKYYQEALEMRLVLYQNHSLHSSIAASYNNMGMCYRHKKEYDLSIKYHTKSLQIQELVFKNNLYHPEIAMNHNNLGITYNYLQNYTKAEKHLQKALQIRLVAYKKAHPDISASYNNLGELFFKQKDYNKSIEYYEKAIQGLLLTHKNTPHHPIILHLYHNIGLAYAADDKFRKAEYYYIQLHSAIDSIKEFSLETYKLKKNVLDNLFTISILNENFVLFIILKIKGAKISPKLVEYTVYDTKVVQETNQKFLKHMQCLQNGSRYEDDIPLTVFINNTDKEAGSTAALTGSNTDYHETS